jgi:radical SAM protein with 4Fe4S-binding SPASM domain
MKQLYHILHRLFMLISYLSTSKLINRLKLTVSYFFSLLGFQIKQNIYPIFVSVEITNYCNLHCPECPVGVGQFSKMRKTTFDLSLYKKLIDELKPTLEHIILYFQGEPFLNKRLPELIKYAHDSRIYTSTSTNGQFLNEKTAKEIVQSGLDKIIISIDGSTQPVYETYRVGGELQKAIDGINYLNIWKKTLKSITPLIEIQFLVLKTNEHQMKEMQKMEKSLHADRLTFKTAQLNDFENGSNFLTTKNRYARYKKTVDGKYILKGKQPNHCWRVWSGAVINVQGEVLPCCFDKASGYSFGNILEYSFLSCWQSKIALGFRKKIIKNRKQFEMCRNCTE